MAYLSALDENNADALTEIERQLSTFYCQPKYHDSWIKGINANWNAEAHPAQMILCSLIPPYSRVLEVGCGDGSAASEIVSRTANIEYVGIDVNADAWRSTDG